MRMHQGTFAWLWGIVVVLTGATGAVGAIGSMGVAGGVTEAAWRNPKPVTVETQWSLSQAHAGDQRALAVVMDVRDGYHINPDAAQLPNDVDFIPVPTVVQVEELGKSLTVGQVQFPAATLRKVAYAAKPLPVFQGRTVIYLPIIVAADAHPGPATLTVHIRYQACNDQVCLRPSMVTKRVTLDIVPRSQAITDLGSEPKNPLFAGFDPSVFAAMQGGGTGAIPGPGTARLAGGAGRGAAERGEDVVRNNFFGFRFTLDAKSPAGLALILLVALAAGFLLNFTPCVLPVVPLKIMALHQQAQRQLERAAVKSGDKEKNAPLRFTAKQVGGRGLWLGLVFAAGIVATFAVLGVLVAGLIAGLQQFQWGQIFAYTPVSVALAVILILMALGMLGFFSIRLPKAIYLLNPSHDTAGGNFLFGVLTAVLSTPCTGPLMGGTLIWAIKQTAVLALMTFIVMGIGMALPYLVLIANPRWLARLPRTGPGSLLLKQVMGLLLLAVAAFFLGPVIPGQGEWWVVAGIITMTMIWMVYRTYRITGKWLARAAMPLIACAFIGGSVSAAYMLTRPGPIPWQAYSHKAFTAARDSGKTILVEFTADWCGNCKALELTVYRNAKLASLFHGNKYQAFRVDLTAADNVHGWALQRKLAPGAGIPLAAVYQPHQAKPTVFQGLRLTAGQLTGALEGTGG